MIELLAMGVPSASRRRREPGRQETHRRRLDHAQRQDVWRGAGGLGILVRVIGVLPASAALPLERRSPPTAPTASSRRSRHQPQQSLHQHRQHRCVGGAARHGHDDRGPRRHTPDHRPASASGAGQVQGGGQLPLPGIDLILPMPVRLKDPSR